MGIIQKAEQFVFILFKDKLSPAFTYHNFSHTLKVVDAVREIIPSENLSETETTSIILAAYFHDTGYIGGTDKHEERSAEIFRKFASDEKIDEEIVSLTDSLIRITEFDKSPKGKLEGIIRDADTAHFGYKNYIQISELLREEWSAALNQDFSDEEWLSGNRKMLMQKHRYFSDYAKKNWQKRKDKNILLLQEKLNELSPSEVVSDEIKKDSDEKPEKPGRGIETMFKVTLNNHTQLSQIADSKANILLSVNAIIISISLSTLIPKLDSPGNAHLILPTFILLLFNVISIIFAILSTKPKVTTGSFTRKEIDEQKVNLLFFGNFYKMPLDEYQWAMNEMMKDKDYLYNSMIKDLYYLGLVLNRKYKLLRITYNIFMIGIIVSVIAFVVAFQSIRA